jgi:two-component system, NarL family, sensor histidine kinase UhpB
LAGFSWPSGRSSKLVAFVGRRRGNPAFCTLSNGPMSKSYRENGIVRRVGYSGHSGGVAGVSRVNLFWVVLFAILSSAGLLASRLIPDFSSVRAYALTVAGAERQAVVDGAFIRPQSFNPMLGPLTRTAFIFPYQGRASEPVAIYAPAYGGDIRIVVNGKIIDQNAMTTPVRLNRYRSASVAVVPAGIIHPGQNSIVLEQYNNATNLTALPIYAGPAHILSGASAHYLQVARFMRTPIAVAIITAIGMAMFLVFFAQKPGRYFCLLGMFLLLLIIKNDTEWTVFDQPVIRFINYVGCAYELMAFLAFSFWTNGTAKERAVGLAASAVTLFLILVADLIFGLDSQKTVAFRIAIFVLPGSMIVMFVAKRMVEILPTLNAEAQVVFAIITALVIGFLSNLIGMYYPMDIEFTYLSSIITQMLTALCLVSLSGFALYFELSRYRAALRGNEAMASIVAGHGLELGQQSQRLKSEIERRAVLEERQRFTRDMHDGIGGQLLSLLLKARSGDVAMDEVERDVAQSLNDLRLVAASLDGADDGFMVSLHSFRERASDQLRAAKIALDWQEDERVALIDYGPRETLDVLRIVQEAITNIIRHAQAGRVTLSIGVDNASARLIIAVTDDGIGLRVDVADSRGNGIKNMRIRAARLGGSLSLLEIAGGSGAVLRLSLPCPDERVS